MQQREQKQSSKLMLDVHWTEQIQFKFSKIIQRVEERESTLTYGAKTIVQYYEQFYEFYKVLITNQTNKQKTTTTKITSTTTHNNNNTNWSAVIIVRSDACWHQN